MAAAAQRLGHAKNLEGILLNFRDRVDYGIEQAVLSGTRIRLWHQIEGRPQFNCAEAGVNLYLLARTVYPRSKVRLMRYKPMVGSSHFGVVIKGRGKLFLFDPFADVFGSVKFGKDGIVVFPKGLEREYGETKYKPCEVQNTSIIDRSSPFKLLTPYWLLSDDEVMQHVNYINSGDGFVPYLSDGQAIADERKGDLLFGTAAQLTKEGLVFYITAGLLKRDNEIEEIVGPLLTVARTLRPDGSVTYRQVLHDHFEWIRPMAALYVEEDGKETFNSPVDDSLLESSHIWYSIGPRAGFSHLYSQVQRNAYIERMGLTIAIWRMGAIPNEHEAQRVLGSFGQSIVTGNPLECLESQYRLYMSAKADLRSELVDEMLHRVQFLKYRNNEQNEYPFDEVFGRMRTLLDARKSAAAPRIAQFLSSEVLNKLTWQYLETMSSNAQGVQILA